MSNDRITVNNGLGRTVNTEAVVAQLEEPEECHWRPQSK
jgi:hypothetical protein